MVYFKLVVTAIVWGGTFIAGRIVSFQAQPFSAAFLRFLIASIVLLIFLARSSTDSLRIGLSQLGRLSLLGLTGVFLYNYFFFAGLETVSAGRASLIIATNPAVIALLAALLFGEQLTAVKTIGIFLSIAGAMVVISRGDPLGLLGSGLGRGELYILACVAAWVSYTLLGKWVMSELSPMVAVTYSCLIGTVMLIVPAVGEGVFAHMWHYATAVWMSLFFLGLFGSAVGFFWYYEGIRAIGASRAGVFINIVPISAIVLGFLILGEAIDASLVVGAVLVSIGVYLTNRTPTPHEPQN